MDKYLSGRCACGAVSFKVRGAPIFINNCHCTLCQRQTGSTSVVNAFYETDRLSLLQGELTTHEVMAGSGEPQKIVRCMQCGTALWSHYPRMGELGAGVRVSTLDEGHTLRPDAAIFVADKMPWVTLPEGIPGFEKTYNPADVLPPDRFARLQALVALRKAQQP